LGSLGVFNADHRIFFNLLPKDFVVNGGWGMGGGRGVYKTVYGVMKTRIQSCGVRLGKLDNILSVYCVVLLSDTIFFSNFY